MATSSTQSDPQSNPALKQWLGVGRAVGGAVIFGLPLMMTMEMWWLGAYIEPLRLLCLLLLSFPLLVGVSSVIGFTESRELVDNVIDVFVAYAFGFVVAALVLFSFSTLNLHDSPGVIFNTIMLQAIPGSLGALLGRSELGSGEHDRMKEKEWSDGVVVMSIGALFLALNVAPTEEIPMISYQMSFWHLLGLFVTTLLIMGVFVVAGSYSEGERAEDSPETVIGYVCHTSLAVLVAAGISLFMLWVFGRTDDLSLSALISNVIVLLFPAGIGAAAARLII